MSHSSMDFNPDRSDVLGTIAQIEIYNIKEME